MLGSKQASNRHNETNAWFSSAATSIEYCINKNPSWNPMKNPSGNHFTRRVLSAQTQSDPAATRKSLRAAKVTKQALSDDPMINGTLFSKFPRTGGLKMTLDLLSHHPFCIPVESCFWTCQYQIMPIPTDHLDTSKSSSTSSSSCLFMFCTSVGVWTSWMKVSGSIISTAWLFRCWHAVHNSNLQIT